MKNIYNDILEGDKKCNGKFYWKLNGISDAKYTWLKI